MEHLKDSKKSKTKQKVTLKQADQILVIESGNIAERAIHDELILVGGRYFNLYTYQSKI